MPSLRARHRTLSPCPGIAHFTLQVPWQVALGDTSGSCLVTGPVCGPAGEAPGPRHLSSEGPQWLASQCTCFTGSQLWPGDKSMSVGGRPLCRAPVGQPGSGGPDLLLSGPRPLSRWLAYVLLLLLELLVCLFTLLGLAKQSKWLVIV